MQTSKSEFDHAVGADLEYGFKWNLPLGDTVADSDWEVPVGITMRGDKITGNITTAFITGLTEGSVHIVTNHIITSMGSKDSRSLILSCKKRFP